MSFLFSPWVMVVDRIILLESIVADVMVAFSAKV